MAAGKPIIGSINGSCANLIDDEGIGYCCNSGDSEALANMIKQLNTEGLLSKGKRAKSINKYGYNKKCLLVN